MRKIYNINNNWKFIKKDITPREAVRLEGENVNLPYTWNAIDGQDGGNDYHRDKCSYVKVLDIPALNEGQQVFLEFNGVNSSADIYVNDQHLTHHDGGYSTFRVNITNALNKENTLVVEVDNKANRHVYPQKADFTFYGGIYRDVNMIIVNKDHFFLMHYGSPGIHVTPVIKGDNAQVNIKTWVTGKGFVRYTVPGIGITETVLIDGAAEAVIMIPKAHLWDGLNDPYLYTVIAELIHEDVVVDTIEIKFGCRSIEFDKDKGFFLNGKSYPLRGVSRHQDRKGVGNAITKVMQEEDMDIMLEMGVNTVRLAHYQHDQYFYDLCDKKGMIVWAEIPYISEHMPEANENTVSQLTELIEQNYNHPSIVCWGLSNEITAVGGDREEIIEQHKVLNDLAHNLDASRPTVTANVFMLDIDSKMLDIPDIISYNLYYGWYLGVLKDNDEFFDTFRKKHPDKIIGLSEYGADGNPKFHSTIMEPNYTEDYQAYYHEHMIKMINKRPYLWATHLWNIFDFGADGRDEGGEHGLNQKGLVTFDRKLKKDSFYLYKAYWSKDPFIHIAGKRYIDRDEEITKIKVYSNCPEIALYVDGNLFEEKKGNNIFTFDVSINFSHKIEARYANHHDGMEIKKVSKANPDYALPSTEIINWFDDDIVKDGCFTVKDTLDEISSVPEGAVLIKKLMDTVRAKRGDVAQGITMNEAMKKAFNSAPLEKMLMRAGDSLDKDFIKEIVLAISNIKKPIQM